jgi:hypothetical protein
MQQVACMLLASGAVCAPQLTAAVIISSVLTPETVTTLEHAMIGDPRLTRGVGGSGLLLGG